MASAAVLIPTSPLSLASSFVDYASPEATATVGRGRSAAAYKSTAVTESESESESLPPVVPLPPGLHNLGNTCYLGAATQMLASLKGFAADAAEFYGVSPCGAVCSCSCDDKVVDVDDVGIVNAMSILDDDSGGTENANASRSEVGSGGLSAQCPSGGVNTASKDEESAAAAAPTEEAVASSRRENSCSGRRPPHLPLRDALAKVISALRDAEDANASRDETAPPRPSSESSKAVDPSGLKAAVDGATPLFAGYDQQDGHEFLGALLALLHDEMEMAEKTKKLDTCSTDRTAPKTTTDFASRRRDSEAEGKKKEEYCSKEDAVNTSESADDDEIAILALAHHDDDERDGARIALSGEIRSIVMERARLVGGRAAAHPADAPAPLLRLRLRPRPSGPPDEEDANASAAERGRECECGAAAATPVDEHFTVEVRARLACNTCGARRDRIETFRHLSLEVGVLRGAALCRSGGDYDDDDVVAEGGGSVEEGLRRFFAPETVQVKCEEKGCNGTRATRTSEIARLPRALLLHFKRFIVDISPDYTSITYRKDHSPVLVPESMSLWQSSHEVRRGQQCEAPEREESKKPVVLALDQFLAENVTVPSRAQRGTHNEGLVGGGGASSRIKMGNGSSPTVDLSRQRDDSSSSPRAYRLKSVVHHLGASAGCGHYIADARRSGEWMRFDDRTVSRITSADVTGEASRRTAYMALFELE